MNGAICGAVAAPRALGSLFNALDDLERAASRLPSTAEYSALVANRYLGPPEEMGCSDAKPKEPDDSNVVRRLVALTRRIDDAASAIEYNLNRLSE